MCPSRLEQCVRWHQQEGLLTSRMIDYLREQVKAWAQGKEGEVDLPDDMAQLVEDCLLRDPAWLLLRLNVLFEEMCPLFAESIALDITLARHALRHRAVLTFWIEAFPKSSLGAICFRRRLNGMGCLSAYGMRSLFKDLPSQGQGQTEAVQEGEEGFVSLDAQ